MNIGLMLTACKRPYYLGPVLSSWYKADGVSGLCGMAVALGQSDKECDQLSVIRAFAPGAHIWLDSPRAALSNGMHRAIAEATTRAFSEFDADFMIMSEEDLQVSSDVIQYMTWAAEKFYGDRSVLAVCSSVPGGHGWDSGPAQDQNADQELVHLMPYFSAWCIGVWRYQWEDVLKPSWDYDCNSGGPMNSGWDWHIATRILPQAGKLCVVPDAARCQNIGQYEGWAGDPDRFDEVYAHSFRETRTDPYYRLEGE